MRRAAFCILLRQAPFKKAMRVWSPDSTSIVFSSRERGPLDLYHQPIDGGVAEPLVSTTENKLALDWSRDGFILYELSSSRTGFDLLAWSLKEKKSFPIAQTSANEDVGRFSPDGHWVAYQSNETGKNEVWIQSFPGGQHKTQV